MSTLIKFLGEIAGGINMLDVGCSGDLGAKWRPIKGMINVVGFDPNKEECARLNAMPSEFRSSKFLPYALSGAAGTATLYKTKSIYCYSLLRPNTSWSRRFSYSELFEYADTESVAVKALADVAELSGVDVDIIKCDTQGLELPILSNATPMLDESFRVEVETGFTENYIGETTYSQIDEFMRAHGFLMFDINVSHRVPRKNIFQNQQTGNEQILWCESTWLKDYVGLARSAPVITQLTREKVLKVLVLCGIQGCIDYGLELAELFLDLGLISSSEYEKLTFKHNWRLTGRDYMHVLINFLLRGLPGRARVALHKETGISLTQPHILRSLLGQK